MAYGIQLFETVKNLRKIKEGFDEAEGEGFGERLKSAWKNVTTDTPQGSSIDGKKIDLILKNQDDIINNTKVISENKSSLYRQPFTAQQKQMSQGLTGADPNAVTPQLPIGSGNTMYSGDMFIPQDNKNK